jgi:hypothetical protein
MNRHVCCLQVALLQRQAAADGCADVEVSTVDRYQGRDKQCILMSFVRSNTDRWVAAADLLKLVPLELALLVQALHRWSFCSRLPCVVSIRCCATCRVCADALFAVAALQGGWPAAGRLAACERGHHAC